ncbi:MAG: AAA family ATPase [Pirellulales bacterium]
MRITDIKVDGFGMWKGLGLDELSAGLTVFYGPNEAGKTTLLQFVRSVLYGIDDKRRRRYLPPVYGGRSGGALAVRCATGRFRVERHWDAHKSGDREEQVIRGTDDRPLGAGVLRTALGGIDETMFNNVFAVGLTELQQLGSLSDTQAAQQLYGLAMGTDRVSLAEVSRVLEERRDQIWATSDADADQPCQIQRLLKERHRLREALKESQSSTLRWSKLAQRRDALEAEIQQLQRREAPSTGDLPFDQWVKKCRAKWRKAAELQRKLRADHGVEIPAAAVDRLREISQQLDQQQEKLAELLRQQDLLRLEMGVGLDREDPVWDVAPVLELADQRTRVRSLMDSVRQSRQKVEECEFEFQTELEKLGFPTTDGTPGALLWGAKALAALAEPARMVEDQQGVVEQFQRDVEQRRRDAEDLKQKYRDALARMGIHQVDQAEQDARGLVDLLNHRIGLQDRWDKLGRDQRDLQQESRYWVNRMVLPWRVIVMFGALFSVGATMVLAAWWWRLFHVAAEQRGPLALIGLCLLGASLIMRRAMEFSAQHRWGECRQQVRRLQRQKEQVAAEAAEMDRRLPSAGGPWVKQLEKAQRELREVQSLTPLHDRYQKALVEAEGLHRRVAEANSVLKDARRGWQQALLTLGLPESLTYEQVRQIMADNGPLMRLRARLESLRHDARTRESELEVVQQKINRFAERLELNLLLSEEDIEQRLVTVVESARRLRDSQQKLAEARKKMREWQRDEQLARESSDVLTKRRQQIVEQYRAIDAQEVETRFQQQQADRETRQQRDALIEEVCGLLGEKFSVDELRLALQSLTTSPDADVVEQSLQKWDADHQAAELSLSQLHEARGKISEQIKSLARDQQSGKLRLKLDVVETRLKEALLQWTALSTMSQVLDGIRTSYESERQPETLAEASTYLNQLTAGRYTRIWTPFGEATLSVDTQDGKPLPVSKLSRGTREQVYLSLRLALAAEYGRRGSPMPIVLDDVFVNFDTRRALAAVKTIKDYADQGHQVLLFTCHDHIRDMFHRLGCDVRTLPDARVVAGVLRPEDVAPVEPLPVITPPPAPVAEPVAEEPTPEPVEVVAAAPEPQPEPQPEPVRKKRRRIPEPVEQESFEEEPVTIRLPVVPTPVETEEYTVEVVLTPVAEELPYERPAEFELEWGLASEPDPWSQVDTVWVAGGDEAMAAGADGIETVYWQPAVTAAVDHEDRVRVDRPTLWQSPWPQAWDDRPYAGR